MWVVIVMIFMWVGYLCWVLDVGVWGYLFKDVFLYELVDVICWVYVGGWVIDVGFVEEIWDV